MGGLNNAAVVEEHDSNKQTTGTVAYFLHVLHAAATDGDEDPRSTELLP